MNQKARVITRNSAFGKCQGPREKEENEVDYCGIATPANGLVVRLLEVPYYDRRI